MKKKNIIIIIGAAVVLALVIIGASLLYNKLSQKAKEDFVEYQTTAEDMNIQPESESENTPAKIFTMLDDEDNEIKLSDFFDKPVVLNFWASWCPPCRAEMPDFEKMYNEYGDRINFVFVNLTDGTRETRESANNFMEEQGFSFPIYYDTNGEGSDAFNIYYIPDTFFIDKEGNVADYAVGGIDSVRMQQGIDMLLAE